MAAKPESQFWHRLRDATKTHPVHWTRLESWATPGVPDLHGIIDGRSFWLELKICKNKIRVNLPKLLSPHQIAWQTSYLQHGGRVYNLVDRPRSGLLDLYDGGFDAMDDRPLAVWSGQRHEYDGLMDHLRSALIDGPID